MHVTQGHKQAPTRGPVAVWLWSVVVGEAGSTLSVRSSVVLLNSRMMGDHVSHPGEKPRGHDGIHRGKTGL